MADADPTELSFGSRAIAGVRALLGRQMVVQVINLVAAVVLARLLDPVDFGIYALITASVAVFNIFGDLGLGARLIQMSGEPTSQRIHTTFTLQFALAWSIVLLVWLLTWAAGDLVGLPDEVAWQVRVVVLTLPLLAVRAVPVIQLERHLQFSSLARVEIVEVVAYQAACIALASTGFGVWSFVLAALLQAALGPLLLIRAAPVRPRLTRALEGVKDTVAFGFKLQTAAIVNSLTGLLTPATVGPVLGPTAMGFYAQASANANRGLLVMDVISRVSFPHLSRITGDRESSRRVLQKYLETAFALLGLWCAFLLACAPDLVVLVYGRKWEEAASPLRILACAGPALAATWLLYQAYAAEDRAGVVAWNGIFRLVAQLVLGVAAAVWFGLDGYAAVVVAVNWVLCALLAAQLGEFTRRFAGLAARTAMAVAGAAALGSLSTSLVTGRAVSVALAGVSVTVAYTALLAAVSSAPQRSDIAGTVRRMLPDRSAR